MNYAFDYATIGFRPYAETGEFVTVGVLAYQNETRQFGFRLLTANRCARVNGLFPKLDRQLFRTVLEHLQLEMTGLQKTLTPADAAGVPFFQTMVDEPNAIFQAITSPREGLFFFPKKGRRLAEDMEAILADLKYKFIDQNLSDPNRAIESNMTRSIRAILKKERILRAYQENVKLGTPEFQVTFPLVHFHPDGTRADRAIRPLNLNLETSSDIYNHGDEWAQRIRRLQRLGQRPDRCLIALKQPDAGDELRTKAFEAIRQEFEDMEIETADEQDAARIVNFSRIPEEKSFRLAAG